MRKKPAVVKSVNKQRVKKALKKAASAPAVATIKKPKINSRAKGAVAERELANWLKERGIPARRGQQFKGGTDSPDVVADLPGWHIESKRVENLQLYPAMAQATKDAPKDSIPVVLHRRNGKEWVAILPAEAWLALARRERDLREAAVLG